VKAEPYPYTARAWLGDVKVAESESCLCVEADGAPAVLYFPRHDIDFSSFTMLAPSSATEAGETEGWSGDSGSGDEGDEGDEGDVRDGLGRTQAGEVLTVVTEASPELEALIGYGAFDADRIRVEVVDGRGRDLTVKRFPTWGDSSHLIDLLDVRRDGDRRFVSIARNDGRRPVVEGSQMLAQAIVATGRCATDRRPVSAGMLFLRAADASRALVFELDQLSAGRTFTGLAARVLQGGRCCGAGTVLLDTTATDVINHEVAPPDVPGPYECRPYDMGVTGRDLRVVDDAYTGDPEARVGPPVLDCWVRFRDVPADPLIHSALLAQFTGHMSIAAAMRPHAGIGQDQAHRSLSTAINAINLSLHQQVSADEWMLYHHLSTFAGDGMTHSECRVHGEDGRLLASFTVDAMVRPFAGTVTGAARDERTAL
jgi:acyl-CoA thioesterase II